MRVQLLIYSLILASALGIAHPPAGAMAGDDDAATGNYAEVSYDLALPDGPLDSFTPTNVGGKEESIDLTVFGPDDRTQVLDTTPSPYRTVAFLIGFDKYGDPDLSCSGVMLNYNVVLTAAHCLWQDGAAVPSIAVIPGANGDARP